MNWRHSQPPKTEPSIDVIRETRFDRYHRESLAVHEKSGTDDFN
jgi:hypothetical protein